MTSLALFDGDSLIRLATDPLALFGVVFGTFFVQFMLIAGGAFVAVWQLGSKRFDAARIQARPRPAKPGRELMFSLISVAIISALLTAMIWLGQLGFSRIYFSTAQHGWLWFAATVAIMAVVHDSYYYWAHRWMHHPRVFRHVHKLHHTFSNPTPFASYAFHPLEAIVEVAWFAPLAFVVPMHPLAVLCYTVVLTVLNVISHLGYEFYPPKVARWFITSTHHNMHHSRSKGHFMLYFNLWDRWMGTNQVDYEAEVAAIHARRRTYPEMPEPAGATA